jgi:DNA-directed RNA polymerase subunit F
MPETKIINERPITMTELAEDLATLEKEGVELNFRSNKAKTYLNNFKKVTIEQVEEITKKIEELEVPRLKDRHMVKIIDILPQNLDEIRMIFTGETTTVADENLKKILDIVKEYVKKK